MIRKQLSRLLIVAVMGMITLVSCRKDDRIEPRDTSQHADSIKVYVTAEIGIDDGDLRALELTLQERADGKRLPRLRLNDGDEVPVHTVFHDDRPYDSPRYGKIMKWKYDAAGHKLVIRHGDEGNSVTLPNTSGRWYVAGFIGDITESSVAINTFTIYGGSRTVRGVRDLGQSLGVMNIPYSFDWQELVMHEAGGRDVDGSHMEASIRHHALFKPMGTLIAFRLGNALPTGVSRLSLQVLRYIATLGMIKSTSNMYILLFNLQIHILRSVIWLWVECFR